MTTTYLWVIHCYNDWCSGPGKWAVTDEKPTTPQHCPTCNWLASPGDGIVKMKPDEINTRINNLDFTLLMLIGNMCYGDEL